ncbi:MAG: AAA family ATPase [Gemmatimonadales bacterium]|nr:AAA family ATPase [Gemmatimonadales bacterium]
MSDPFIIGHEQARTNLAAAHQAGRLPQVLLVTGERGVGKQTLGRWLAALTLCENAGAPCGTCRGCRLVAGLSHPDFHWFVPIPRPKASDPDKQVEEVRETLGEVMAGRRENSAYLPPDGLAMHGVASARLILRTGTLTTVHGGRRVILIGGAERLVPQEANQEAANALLKFLEEPTAQTIVVLTTTDPSRVLPTIRSRAVPIRLGRLTPDQVEAGLTRLAPTLSAAERRQRAAHADGSIGRALAVEGGAAINDEVEQLLTATRDGGSARFERVLKQGPWAARGDFSLLLDGLTQVLSNAARATAGGPAEPVPAMLRDVRVPGRFLRALDRIEAVREAARVNVNPQLLLATLTAELSDALWA